MPTADPPLADLWPLLAIGALILIAWLRDVVRARRERRSAAQGPYLVFPVERREPGSARITPAPLAPLPPPVEAGGPVSAMGGHAPASNGHAPGTNGSVPAATSPALVAAPAVALGARPAARPAAVDPASQTIRMDPAMEGTIQLLPGWLEVVRGMSAGHEIRFVRVRGDESPEITLGRADGPEYRHIRLPEGTVSRLHARMSYRNRSWQIANLSRTNPVRVNGRMLFTEQDVAVLADGDCIELGEVELRFREGAR